MTSPTRDVFQLELEKRGVVQAVTNDVTGGITFVGTSGSQNLIVGRPASYYGIFPSLITDHTAKFIAAIADCAANGYALVFPEGDFNIYTAQTETVVNCSIIGAGSKLTRIWNRSPNGTKTLLRWTVGNVVVKGFQWLVPNVPKLAINDATEASGFIKFQSPVAASPLQNILCEDLRVNTSYGVGILFRHVWSSQIINCHLQNVYKDGFHINGNSAFIQRIGCSVSYGGDDAFAVVGYDNGDVYNPHHISDVGNIVRGVRFARGMSWVGSDYCSAAGCQIDGLVPAGMTYIDGTPYDTTGSLGVYSTGAGVYVASEIGTGTGGNTNLNISGFNISNCGNSTYAPIQISGRSAHVSRDICIQANVSRCGNHGVVTYGDTDSIVGLNIDVSIDQITDPNGIRGTAGAGEYHGALLQTGRNVSFKARSIKNAGGSGVYCYQGASVMTGSLEIDINTIDISNTGNASSAGILVQSQCAATKKRLRIGLISQSSTNTAGQTGYLQRAINDQQGAAAKTEIIVEDLGANWTRPGGKVVVANKGSNWSQVGVTVSASPFTFTNTQSYPVLVDVTGGNVSQITRGLTTGISSPAYVDTGRTGGVFKLDPGQSLVVTYSSAPSMQWVACNY